MAQVSNYRELFLSGQALLDVRAPVEFAKGAFPTAINLPLLDDQQRHEVGIAYQQRGNTAARALGHELVSGQIRQQRLSDWQTFVNDHPDAALYCFRGGERSAIAQSWLAEVGVDCPRIEGGYKAMRRFLLDSLARLASEFELVLIGGRTGVGKTDLLLQLPGQADLEGLANHRGSGFGRRPGGQPSQVDFENALAIRLLCIEAAGHQRLILEDESPAIGRCHVPPVLWQAFDRARLVVLEDSLANRVARIRRDYVDGLYREYCAQPIDDPFETFADALTASLGRISRRLGGDRYQQLGELMDKALQAQRASGAVDLHDRWIEPLLVDYYDPMYDYQLANKQPRIAARGNAALLIDYLATPAGLASPSKT